jgi:hypothetical protein
MAGYRGNNVRNEIESRVRLYYRENEPIVICVVQELHFTERRDIA